MAVLLNQSTKVIVQGMTGKQGSFHAKSMIEYGTQVVAGVTPGKGGQEVLGVPIYDTMKEAVEATQASASVIFIPAPFVYSAALEAIDSGIELLTIITEGVPVRDTARIRRRVFEQNVTLVGPNCPGLITPGEAKIGIIPGAICSKGNVGIVSRSGTLTYEIIQNLTLKDYGQSTCIGLGGDPIRGIDFKESPKKIYEKYKFWCDDVGHRPMAKNRVYNELTERFGKKIKIDGYHYYTGITLLDPLDF